MPWKRRLGHRHTHALQLRSPLLLVLPVSTAEPPQISRQIRGDQLDSHVNSPGLDSRSICPLPASPSSFSQFSFVNCRIFQGKPDPHMVSLNRRRYRTVCDPAQAGTCTPGSFCPILPLDSGAAHLVQLLAMLLDGYTWERNCRLTVVGMRGCILLSGQFDVSHPEIEM